MDQFRILAKETLWNVFTFAAGGEIVALLTSDRRNRGILLSPVSKEYYHGVAIARWGHGCVCNYADYRDIRGDDHDGDKGTGGGTGVHLAAAQHEIDIMSSHETSGSAAAASNAIVNGAGGASPGDRNAIDTTSTNPRLISDCANKIVSQSMSRSDNVSGKNWLAYYLRRVGHGISKPSPSDLIQEHFAEDAYRLLSCCIISSQTNKGEKVMKAVRAFLEVCPTPSHALSVDVNELRGIMASIDRLKFRQAYQRGMPVREFAQDFLTLPWFDPSELRGCGKFASDSWKVFCLGVTRPGPIVVSDRKNVKRLRIAKKTPLDRSLAGYCRFAKQQKREKAQREVEAAAADADNGDLGSTAASVASPARSSPTSPIAGVDSGSETSPNTSTGATRSDTSNQAPAGGSARRSARSSSSAAAGGGASSDGQERTPRANTSKSSKAKRAKRSAAEMGGESGGERFVRRSTRNTSKGV